MNSYMLGNYDYNLVSSSPIWSNNIYISIRLNDIDQLFIVRCELLLLLFATAVYSIVDRLLSRFA